MKLRPCTTMVRALVLLTEGTEEMEFAIAYDVLVRAGIDAQSVYVPAEGTPNTPEAGYVTAARGVKIVPDTTLAQLDDTPYDAIVVPGGAGGANILSQDKAVLSMLKSTYDANKVVGAICAGSLAPLHAGIGLGGPITSHPSVKEQLQEGTSGGASLTYSLCVRGKGGRRRQEPHHEPRPGHVVRVRARDRREAPGCRGPCEGRGAHDA